MCIEVMQKHESGDAFVAVCERVILDDQKDA